MQITTNVKIIGDKMQYIKYFNTRTMLHNFKEAVNLTNQLGIKNAIAYNINDYLFTVGKNFVADKIDKIQDKLIVGITFTKYEDINNVCSYLERINPKLYKKYLDQSNGDNLRFVKDDQIHYRLPYSRKYFFKCKDKTRIVCQLYSGDFLDSTSIFFIGPHRREHADFLVNYCDKYRSKFITIKTLSINKQDILEYDVNDQIDGIDERSIIFPEKYKIFDYIDAWLCSETYFSACGISHKIGILLYGEPGTGKTTFAKILATKYELNLVKFNLNEISKLISKNDFWRELEESVVVLEDIDCLVSKRDESVTSEDKENFQALLQLLDGINSCEKTIFLATTNYIDNLDPALIRDGRFDIKIEMKNFDHNEAVEMCNKFNVDSEVILRDEQFPINPASLQNKIITLQMKEINEKLKQKAQRIRSNKTGGDK